MKKNHGFSLVETLIALIILTIALLALVQIPALYSKLMSLSVEKENATLYAIHALDLVETVDYSSFDGSTNVADLQSDLNVSLDLPSDYSAVLSVDYSVNSSTIQVTIEYPSGIGRKDVSLTRVVSPFADKTAE